MEAQLTAQQTKRWPFPVKHVDLGGRVSDTTPQRGGNSGRARVPARRERVCDVNRAKG